MRGCQQAGRPHRAPPPSLEAHSRPAPGSQLAASCAWTGKRSPPAASGRWGRGLGLGTSGDLGGTSKRRGPAAERLPGRRAGAPGSCAPARVARAGRGAPPEPRVKVVRGRGGPGVRRERGAHSSQSVAWGLHARRRTGKLRARGGVRCAPAAGTASYAPAERGRTVLSRVRPAPRAGERDRSAWAATPWDAG